MQNESKENIEKSIEQLKKLKDVLKQKSKNVELQIQQHKTILSKEHEKQKLKNSQSMNKFFC